MMKPKMSSTLILNREHEKALFELQDDSNFQLFESYLNNPFPKHCVQGMCSPFPGVYCTGVACGNASVIFYQEGKTSWVPMMLCQ